MAFVHAIAPYGAYTCQTVAWDQCVNSTERSEPAEYAWRCAGSDGGDPREDGAGVKNGFAASPAGDPS
jgi:hypothetical protein